MADLEDFFAKRDKKKKFKGKKYDTVDIDDVAKVLDAKAKERKKLEIYQPETPTSDQPGNELGIGTTEDDEWKEMEDNKPDFSGLKIQEFNLEDEEKANSKEEARAEAESAKEVWKVHKPTPKEEPVKSESPEPMPEAEEPTLESVGNLEEEEELIESTTETPAKQEISTTPTVSSEPAKYITPAARRLAAEEKLRDQSKSVDSKPKPLASSSNSSSGMGMGGGGGVKYVPPNQRGGSTPGSSVSKPKKQMGAPNISSDEYFPALGGGS